MPIAPPPAGDSQPTPVGAPERAVATKLRAAPLDRSPFDVGAALLQQREAVLAQCAGIDRRARNRVLIWGNDRTSVESFIPRFWFDVVTGLPESFGCIAPAGSLQALAIAVDTAFSASVDLTKELRTFVAKPATVFLLVDAEAPGSSASQLARSQILSVVQNASALVLVMQRARALENSGSLAEGVLALKALTERMPLAVTTVMANDERWYVTALVAALYHEGHLLKTLRDEKAWAQRFAEPGQLAPAIVAQTLRRWRELSEIS
jgi:hypothetical protein